MKATVVSLLPYPVLSETKPGLFPASYTIPAADEQIGLATLIVSDGQRGVYLDQDRGSESIIVSGTVIARSLVEDYVISQPEQDQTAGPGVFWLQDALTAEQVKKNFASEVSKAAKAQHDWWRRLVRMADDTWQRTRVMAQIGDLDRTACRQLGLKRDWLDDSPDAILKCPVCTTLISKTAIICFACHVVLQPEEYKKFQFAGVPVQPLNAKA